MFNVGDYVVYPGHGVGQILGFEDKKIRNQELKTATVKIISNAMRMIVPMNKMVLRPLVTQVEIDNMFELLKDREFQPNKETWNRRYRTFMQQVNSGSILEIADVLRNIMLLKASKKLSFGEKKMVTLCKDLIVEEVTLISGTQKSQVNNKIDSILSSTAS